MPGRAKKAVADQNIEVPVAIEIARERMISGRNHYRKLRCRILAKALEINRPGRPMGPRTVEVSGRSWREGKARRSLSGPLRRCAGPKQRDRNNKNKAVITVSVSWRIVFIQISTKLATAIICPANISLVARNTFQVWPSACARVVCNNRTFVFALTCQFSRECSYQN